MYIYTCRRYTLSAGAPVIAEIKLKMIIIIINRDQGDSDRSHKCIYESILYFLTLWIGTLLYVG